MTLPAQASLSVPMSKLPDALSLSERLPPAPMRFPRQQESETTGDAPHNRAPSRPADRGACARGHPVFTAAPPAVGWRWPQCTGWCVAAHPRRRSVTGQSTINDPAPSAPEAQANGLLCASALDPADPHAVSGVGCSGGAEIVGLVVSIVAADADLHLWRIDTMWRRSYTQLPGRHVVCFVVLIVVARGCSGSRHRGRKRAGSFPRPASVEGCSTARRRVTLFPRD
jgi:hypothetical protein